MSESQEMTPEREAKLRQDIQDYARHAAFKRHRFDSRGGGAESHYLLDDADLSDRLAESLQKVLEAAGRPREVIPWPIQVPDP